MREPPPQMSTSLSWPVKARRERRLCLRVCEILEHAGGHAEKVAMSKQISLSPSPSLTCLSVHRVKAAGGCFDGQLIHTYTYAHRHTQTRTHSPTCSSVHWVEAACSCFNGQLSHSWPIKAHYARI